MQNDQPQGHGFDFENSKIVGYLLKASLSLRIFDDSYKFIQNKAKDFPLIRNAFDFNLEKMADDICEKNEDDPNLKDDLKDLLTSFGQIQDHSKVLTGKHFKNFYIDSKITAKWLTFMKVFDVNKTQVKEV